MTDDPLAIAVANIRHAPRSTSHFLIYGESGSGKSTGAATFPVPMLVFMFDPHGKERPYVYGLDGTPRGELNAGIVRGTPVTEVVDAGGALLVRIEHYIDDDPRKPMAYARFLERLAVLDRDLIEWKIETLVTDSVTFMELAARKEQQYKLNPNARDPRQWFGGSTDTLEEVIMIRYGALRCRGIVIAHIDEDKDEVHGFFVRNPAFPGRLRKKNSAAFSEVYRAFVKRDDHGHEGYWWQTRSDGVFNATSQLHAPNPCEQRYSAL